MNPDRDAPRKIEGVPIFDFPELVECQRCERVQLLPYLSVRDGTCKHYGSSYLTRA